MIYPQKGWFLHSMSELKFNPDLEILVLDVKLTGKIIVYAKLVLDTGASLTMLPWWIAIALGLKIDLTRLISTTTASSVETSPLTMIPKVTVLGKSVRNVSCLIKDLPPESGIDGLLGLSFLKNFKLSLDFKRGSLILE